MDFKRIAIDTAACIATLVFVDGIYTKKIVVPEDTFGKMIDMSKDIVNNNVTIETTVDAE